MKRTFLFVCLLLSGLMAFAQPPPNAPTVSGNTTICTGSGTTLTASSSQSGVNFVWTNLSGTVLATTPTYTLPTQTAASTFNLYVQSFLNGTNGYFTMVPITVNQSPANFSLSAPGSVTAGTILNLTASPATNSYSWTTSQGNYGSLTGASVYVVPTEQTTYAATETNAAGCTTTISSTVAVAQLVTISGNTALCRGGTTTLTASGSTSYSWYDVATGGTPLSTNATFSTPALFSGKSYWVAGANGIRKKVSITVAPPYSGATVFPAAVCAGQSVNLKSFYTGKTAWYEAPTGGNLIGTTLGNALLSVTPTATKTYYAQPAAFVDTLVFNAGASTWTVPEGVYSIQVEALGSWSGNLGDNVNFTGFVNYGRYNGFFRGFGARVLATIAVMPGQVLYLFVGNSSGSNGGGTNAGARGGGATDIRIGGTSLTNRILVAGGGGGAGYVGTSSINNSAGWTTFGHGGGLIGQDGNFSPNYAYLGGKGGTQSAGGGGNGAGGSFGQGGGAGHPSQPGGNGGGGWYGGGGGADYLGGGGGGSSYTNPQYCSDTAHTQGFWQNEGKLILTYGTATCGAPAARTPVTVTVNPYPVATVASNSPCLGGALTVSSTLPAGALYWKSATGDTVQRTANSWNATATTAAGGNGSGNALNQLNAPRRPFVTANGDVYICDNSNHRVVKWAVGAPTGIVVAGGNGSGSAQNQLNSPQGVYVDDAGTLYIADEGNHRIQRWTAGAGTGTTLFGGNGAGTAANQLTHPRDIIRDDTGNFYVVECYSHRISKWAPGAVSGTVVAGGTLGSGLSQMSYPWAAALDQAGNLYVAEEGNYRVTKWAPGAPAGTVVAGGNGSGSAANQVDPTDVAVDALGNVYVADQFQNRIQRWAPGAGTGTTVAGQLNGAYGVAIDNAGNLYAADGGNNRVQKFTYNGAPLTYTPTAAGTYNAVVSTLAGCAGTTNDKSFITAPAATIYGPGSVCKDGVPANVILTATGSISPYTFSYNINGGTAQTAIGVTRKVRYIRLRQMGNSRLAVGELEAVLSGTNTNVALNKPVTSSGNLYPNPNRVNDGSSASHSIWASSGSGPGTYVEIDLGAGGYNLSEVRIVSTTCCDYSNDTSLELTWRDTAGAVLQTSLVNAYRGINSQHGTSVPNPLPHQLQIPVSTAIAGTTVVTLLNVATTNGCATTPTPGAANTAAVVVNAAPVITLPVGAPCIGTPLSVVATPGAELSWKSGANILQTDRPVWKPAATTVAGGNGAGSGLNQLSSPRFGFAMPDGTFYASDINNNRVLRWDVGATAGVVVAGGNGMGSAANQLNAPRGVYADGARNVYVADLANHRIQKWAAGAASGVTVAGTGTPGGTLSQLFNPIDVAMDDSSNLYISDLGNSRVMRWAPGAASGTTVAGTSGSAGSSLVQLSDPYGLDVDDSGAVYVSDLANNRIVKWGRNATTGIVVAGGNGAGSGANQLDGPTGVAVDPMGNLYVSDQRNNRIQRWTPGATSGVNVTGTGQIGVVHGVQLDAAGNLYVTDVNNNRIQKFFLNDSVSRTYSPSAAGTIVITATSFGGCTATRTKTIETPALVTITAPTDVCKDAPGREVVLTGSGGVSPYTISYSINGGAAQTATTTPRKVRYVRVAQNASGNNLNLAEIQAIEAGTGTNVALNKPATASSTLSGFPLTNINDGVLTNFWHNNSGSNTEYVEIDLGAPGYVLSAIHITNRGDCCQNRSSNLQLSLKNNAGAQLSSQGINAYQNQNNGYTTVSPVNLDSSNQLASLVIPASVVGTYKYKLLNIATAGGCTTTGGDSATVNIRPRATITTQPPALVTLCSGTPLTLNAVAATPATNYQWRRNDIAIAGATSATYNNLALPIADSGNYSVIAIDSLYGCNDTSAASIVKTKLTPAFLLTGPAIVCKDAPATVAFTSPNALYPTYTYTVNNGAAQTATPAYSKIRYIRVAQNLGDFINLAEIQAIDSATGTNVALNKTAIASSNSNGYPAGNINDGSTATNNYWHSNGSAAGEWVEIDLGAPGYNLSAIKITNRGDCCQNRAANLQLTYKDNTGNVVGNENINAYQGQNSGYTASFAPKYNAYGVSVPTPTVGTTTVFRAVSVTTPNGCSSSSADSFVATVKQNTVITVEPDTAKSICTSSPLTLSVAADSATSYQWRRNGTAIAGATAAGYTKSNMAAGDAGLYSVIAFTTGGCSDTSRNSVVTTKASPVGSISGTTALCVGAVSPYVYLSGSGSTAPYTFSYAVNGGVPQTVTATAPKVRYVKISQADFNYLYLAEVQVLERGTGTNVALGKGGTSTDSYASFSTVTDGNLSYYNNGAWESNHSSDSEYVQIDLGPQGYDIDSIRIASFDICCQNVLQYLYVEYKDVNGVPIAPYYYGYIDAYQGQNSQKVSTFPVDFYGITPSKIASVPVPTTPSGIYNYKIQSVTAANGCSFTPADSAVVTINDGAYFTTEPVTTASVCESNPFTLSATALNATGFLWRKENNVIPGATTATYTKASAQSSDAGSYSVIAINAITGCNDTSAVSVISTKVTPRATLTGGGTTCQNAPVSGLVMSGIGGIIPYTFSYSANGVAAQTAVTDTARVRYVRVSQNAGNNNLNLAEIQAIEAGTGTNVALNKTATASSTLAGYPITNINDGVFNNFWHNNTGNANEYIEIDLGAPGYKLSSIKITNREDCCQSRSANLQLSLKDSAGTILNSKGINALQGQYYGFTSTHPVTVVLPVIASVPTANAGIYTYKINSVTGANGCASTPTDSAVYTVHAKAAFTTQPLATKQVCVPNPLVLSAAATNASSYQWRKAGVAISGATDSNWVKSLSNATDAGLYSVIAMGTGGCNDTSGNSIVTAGTLATTTIASTAAADIQMHTDGLNYVYVSSNCEPIAEVMDAAGGNILGVVKAQVVKDASVQTFNLAPYLQRHYDIQPANNGAATVTLYATQAEFDAYNTYITTNNLNTPKLPTGPTDIAGIANINITQFHGLASAGTTGPGGQYNVNNKEVIPSSALTKDWNGNYWTLRFPVSGFSGFFINSSSTNAPLPLSLTAVSARNMGTANEVLWTTATEDPATVFEVERSLDASQFTRIGTVPGTGKENTSYRLVDEAPATGINYYRIRAISAGGENVLSKVVMATVKEGVFVVEAFPNPTRGLVTVRLSGAPGPDAMVMVSDVSGKLLWQVPMRGSVLELSLTELAGGLYFLRYQDGANSQVLKVTKQ